MSVDPVMFPALETIDAATSPLKARIRELEKELQDWKETADRMMDESEQRGQRVAKAQEMLKDYIPCNTLCKAFIEQVLCALDAMEGK